MKYAYFLLGLIFFASCKSAPKTTFVNTDSVSDGKIYTVCVFSQITEVVQISEDSMHKNTIELENCTYDSKSTLLTVLTENSEKHAKYHIEGVPIFPAEFVLTSCKNGVFPLVFYDDNLAVLGKDYTFDEQTSHVKFLQKIDADKSSYLVIWITKDNFMSSIGNKTEKYSEIYESKIENWLDSINFCTSL